MVVNAFGDVVDPGREGIVAGCRVDPESMELADADREILRLTRLTGFPVKGNSVVGMVATNAGMNKVQMTKVAQMAHDGPGADGRTFAHDL